MNFITLGGINGECQGKDKKEVTITIGQKSALYANGLSSPTPPFETEGKRGFRPIKVIKSMRSILFPARKSTIGISLMAEPK
ncbi:hypothetical protein TCT1_20030 [Xenorhabdus sp. TCT-1]|uniref:Uncharacterized protein n=1 Tax=Xenorhabdus taiwanensis TaxID=3085177 RepID=A0ABM8JWK3_9GAMM|nr:hypothetical protein TCT1_20030 [Xenorhabdus sp. TCT-1]